ncbi:sodium channel protein Nach [Rhagoletis pomonella]|uniref:sodium channel protein Nach n=1 Tax=Rhagoletis pomonella TaxID=28610 RepID=UPI001786FFCA|nr:sodium channel protein Nach [Rhagoletis pomonella]
MSFFWLLLLIVSVGMCIYTGLQAMDKWKTKSTVMGLERDFYFWRTPVPSFTVCPMRRLSQELFDKYCHKKKITGQPKEDLQIFLETLANSTYFNFANITVRPSIDSTLDRLRLRPAQYMSLIYNLTTDFTQMADENERIRLNDGFRSFVVRQVLTEFGICYLGNSYLHNEYTARYTIFGKYPKINKEHLQMLTGSYFDSVLLILSVPKAFESIGVFIHSAHDALKIEQKFFYTNEAVYYKAEAREIVAEEGFEKLTTVAQRKCRFPHESNLEHFEIYTKSFCMQECRLNLVYKKCKCIPHFYPNRVPNPKPICSYTTLKSCVAKNAEFFRRLHSSKARKTVSCNCLDSCFNSIVVVNNVEVLANLNVFQTGFSVGLEVTSWPLELLKRQVIFTFTDLLVAVGGAAGLFLGFSVLGAIEFFYYFTLRLIWYLRGYRN